MNRDQQLLGEKYNALSNVMQGFQRSLSNMVSKGQEGKLERYHYIPLALSHFLNNLINLKYIIRKTHPFNPITFIDFGCGFPFTLDLAQSIGFKTRGFEIDREVTSSEFMNIFSTRKNVIRKDITKVTTEDLNIRDEKEILVCYFYVPICGPLQIKFEENLLKIIPSGSYIMGFSNRVIYNSKLVKRINALSETFIKE